LCSLANTYHDIDFASKNRLQAVLRVLLSRQGEGLLRLLDHLTHFANAFGALGLALVPGEDLARTRRAGLDGRGDVTFAKAVAVADVQGREPID
jgi:hypothetical protein